MGGHIVPGKVDDFAPHHKFMEGHIVPGKVDNCVYNFAPLFKKWIHFFFLISVLVNNLTVLLCFATNDLGNPLDASHIFVLK